MTETRAAEVLDNLLKSGDSFHGTTRAFALCHDAIIGDDFYYLEAEDQAKSEFSTASTFQYSSSEDDSIPFTTASIVETSAVDDDGIGLLLSNREEYDSDNDDVACSSSFSSFPDSVPAHPLPEEPFQALPFPRPELLFVSAIKPQPSSPIGLLFKKKRDGAIYISGMKQENLFEQSGMQVGDRVLAVNHMDCTNNLSLHELSCIIQSSETTVSFCLHNRKGDPQTVLSSVQKPSRDCLLGVCFQSRRGALSILTVHDDSLFAGSLLMSNHRCIMINGEHCDNKGAQAAADKTATLDRVTIISRARDDMATVLSVSDEQEEDAENNKPRDSRRGRAKKWMKSLIGRQQQQQDEATLVIQAHGYLATTTTSTSNPTAIL